MDIQHFYIEKGQEMPIILLHGNGENCEYFEEQIDVFAEKYHVYAMRPFQVLCKLKNRYKTY